MDIEFAQLVSAYAEVGILGLCAIMFILVAIYTFKNSHKKDEKESTRVDGKDSLIEGSYKELLKQAQDQNNKLVEQLQEQNKIMMQQFVDKVVHHTISPEESAQQAEIDKQIRVIITKMRTETGACRCSLVKYHNGGRGINGQPFLKMSMTHEDLIVGITPLISDFKEQFRNLLAYFVTTIDTEGKCFIKNIEEVKSKDASIYEFMSIRGIHCILGISITDIEGYPIGFLAFEFENGEKVDLPKIEKTMKKYVTQITLLMNKKILYRDEEDI